MQGVGVHIAGLGKLGWLARFDTFGGAALEAGGSPTKKTLPHRELLAPEVKFVRGSVDLLARLVLGIFRVRRYGQQLTDWPARATSSSLDAFASLRRALTLGHAGTKLQIGRQWRQRRDRRLEIGA
jgi:hypothetical protein